LADLLASNHFSRSLEQQRQNAEGLFLQMYFVATLVEFAGGKVGLKKTKTQTLSPIGRSLHDCNVPP
jgi:hypothetical protein